MIKDKLIGRTTYIFDFDGTLFHLFTTFDFDNELKMLDKEFKRLGFKFPNTWNPFEAFKVANDNTNPNKEEALIFSDRLLTDCELRYIDLGYPVKGAIRLLKYLYENNYKIAIASNNSPLAIKKFIDKYLNGYDIPVIGRIGTKPELLKPNTYMLDELLKITGSTKGEAVFFGDHPRDRECAIACGIEFIPVCPADYKMERMLKIVAEDEIAKDLDDIYNLIAK